MEDVALREELVHPRPARDGGHDVGDVELALVVCDSRSLFGLTNVLAV